MIHTIIYQSRTTPELYYRAFVMKAGGKWFMSEDSDKTKNPRRVFGISRNIGDEPFCSVPYNSTVEEVAKILCETSNCEFVGLVE